MNKKLMAVAVAGALAAPVAVFAQASNVQLYGRINTGFDNYQATGSAAGAAADFKGRNRVFDSASRLGFKGTEDLGNGLKVVFQIESGLNIDSGTATGQSGGANASVGTLSSRDSFAGLTGNWGTFTFGRQSYFWNGAGMNDVIAALWINSGVPWSNSAAHGRIIGPANRQSNTMKYQSPTWNGFNVHLNYSPNSEPAGVAANTDASIWGILVGYTGVIDAHLDYAVNTAASPVAPATLRQRITGTKVDVGWPYAPGARVSLIWGSLKNDQVSGVTAGIGFTAGDNLKQNQWTLNWYHTFGNIMAMAQYGRLGQVSGCTAAAGVASCGQTGANAWTLGVKYDMSKRTSLYASYMRTNNESNQLADYAAGGISSAAATGLPIGSVGADPRLWALGISHWF